MNKEKQLQAQRQRRRYRVRKKVRGTPGRPRLSVYRSNKHLACQIIDDAAGKTLVSASTRDKDLPGQITYGGNREAAALVGKTIAERALQQGITQVRFDRGHYKFHGRVAALANAAREVGLKL